MTIDALLDGLERAGLHLSERHGRLRVDGPAGALTDTLEAGLRAHKAELLRRIARGAGGAPPTLAAGAAGAMAPVSFAQQRLWFLDRLERDAGYRIAVAFGIDGSPGVDALARAWAALVDRHPTLRLRFGEDPEAPGVPVQIFETAIRAELERVDCRADGSALVEHLERIRRAAFDLEAGPLVRAALIRADEAAFVFVLAVHHTAADGWSVGILLRDLSAAYRRAIGQPVPAPNALPITYGDFAVYQRALLQHPSSRHHLAYWSNHLRSAPTLLDLPVDRPRPARQAFDGDRVSAVLDRAFTEALQELAVRRRVTLNALLTAGFAVLMGRYGRTEDVVIGVPSTLRSDTRLEGVVGDFSNPLPIYLQPRRARPFVELVDATARAVADGVAHAVVPFERIVESLNVERGLDRNPVFQVVFSYKPDLTAGFDLPGLKVTRLEQAPDGSAFDLTLNVRHIDGTLVCLFEYDTALFDRVTIERMAANYRVLLDGARAHPSTPVGRLPLVAPEQLAVLDRFNATAVSVPAQPLVHRQVAGWAAETPDAPAVTHRGETITYAELDRRADRVAHHLRQRGVVRGGRVAVCMPKSIDLMVAVLGVLKAGAAYVPLDHDQPARRLAMMLDDCGPPIVLTSTAALDGIPTAPGRARVAIDALDRSPSPAGPVPDSTEASDLAYVKYTSGSTGRPKGVLISHRAVLNTLDGYRADYRGDVMGRGHHHLQCANPAFDIFTGDWIRALCNGGRLVLCDLETVSDPEALFALMVDEGIDFIECVPVVACRLCDHLERAGVDMTFIGCFVVCGDVLHAGDHRRLQQLCGPDALVINSYGVTEAAIHNTLCDRADGHPGADTFGSIGRPMSNTKAYVLDTDGQRVPPGVVGELAVGGDGVAEGYWNRPELTARKFVELELEGRTQRVYRTGDLVRWRADGQLQFIGRTDHQVQLRGLRIEPGEIEMALLEHPAVQTAIVLMREAPEPMLVAWLTLDTPVGDASTAMRAHLSSRVPAHMVPSAFVVLDAMPTTPNGKIDRRALPDPAVREGLAFVPPRDGVEMRLVLVWEQLLERSPIGVTDDFFALGGDSLRAVRLVSLVERAFGHRLPLHVLFDARTVERLAVHLRRDRVSVPFDPLVCLQPEGDATPLFFVHAAGGIAFRYVQVAGLLGRARPFYALQARGIEPGDPLYGSIEEMAADYVRAIRRAQPEGPYLLGGWSFGGTVAFEMARILERQGESVPHVLMVDAPAPDMDSYAEDDVEFLLERLGPAAGLDTSGVEELPDDEARLRYLFEAQRLAGLFVPDISDDDARLRLAVHKHHNRLLCAYTPAGPIGGRVMFYAPSESIPFDARMKAPVPAWRALARGGLDVEKAPGNHFNMFSAINGPRLAAQIGAWLADRP